MIRSLVSTLMLASITTGQLLSQAHAQAIEAKRYTNSQGVEVILSRSTNAGNLVKQEVVSREQPLSEPKPLPTNTKSIKNDTNLQTSKNSIEQRGRDTERNRILSDELSTEINAFNVKKRMVGSSRAKIDLTDEELRKLEQDVHRHEDNIRALEREINSAGIRTAAKSNGDTVDSKKMASQ